MIKLHSLHCIYQYCVPGACPCHEIKLWIPSCTSVHVSQIPLPIQQLSRSEDAPGRVNSLYSLEKLEKELGCGDPVAKPCGSGQPALVEGVDRAELGDALQDSGEDLWDEASLQGRRCAPRNC